MGTETNARDAWLTEAEVMSMEGMHDGKGDADARCDGN